MIYWTDAKRRQFAADVKRLTPDQALAVLEATAAEDIEDAANTLAFLVGAIHGYALRNEEKRHEL